METMLPAGTGVGDKEFKSYYVVWKPIANNSFVTQYRSLNRTMQYGNLNTKRKK